MTVGIFGSNGMLGKYITTVLKKNYNIKAFTRNDLDISDFNKFSSISEIIKDCDIVINCAGAIKPIVDKISPEKSFMINSVFPNYLARICYDLNKKIFHITTDCVYSGKIGSYLEGTFPDTFDTYGLSKSLGESSYALNLRTSIIGEEIGNSRSLIEWVKSNANKEVNGYTNHYWNGVTCLEFAYIMENLIKSEYFKTTTSHIFSPNKVSKYELVKDISEIFGLNIKVKAVEAEVAIDRTLDSQYIGWYPEEMVVKKTIKEQLKELFEFQSKLSAV